MFQVLRAATFDLLFSESDRHGQNIMVSEGGELTLIDNEGTGSAALNSLFLPGTQKYETVRIGYAAVCCANMLGSRETNCPVRTRSRGAACMRRGVSNLARRSVLTIQRQGKVSPSAPESLLDYRCHLPKGGGSALGLGPHLPPGVAAFAARIAAMPLPDAIAALMAPVSAGGEFGLTHEKHTERLIARCSDLSSSGFEGALAAQLWRQPPGDGATYGHAFRYPVPLPCCDPAACALRLARGYVGPLTGPLFLGNTSARGVVPRLAAVPWTHPAYPVRPFQGGFAPVGGPAPPPLDLPTTGVSNASSFARERNGAMLAG